MTLASSQSSTNLVCSVTFRHGTLPSPNEFDHYFLGRIPLTFLSWRPSTRCCGIALVFVKQRNQKSMSSLSHSFTFGVIDLSSNPILVSSATSCCRSNMSYRDIMKQNPCHFHNCLPPHLVFTFSNFPLLGLEVPRLLTDPSKEIRQPPNIRVHA